MIDQWKQISPWMVDAIISVEDKRFWPDPGVDLRGVARAVLADVTGGATQGASTIAEQFVKNTLNEENNRTIFEKLREAALAFQLTHKWKKTKILTEYLNSIYFGNGAYGVESAARVYFGKTLGYDPNAPADGQTSRCGDSTRDHPLPSCASQLQPWQAALLAGMVANPSAFNPAAYPQAAAAPRPGAPGHGPAALPEPALSTRWTGPSPCPRAADLEQPQEPTAAPYFTSWLAPQILRAMGYGSRASRPSVAEYRAYYGGLKIKTTLDLPHAAGGRPGDLPGSAVPKGRDRGLTGGDRQLHGSGAGDGRRPGRQRPGGLPAVPVQPGHRGRAPARVGLQALHPGSGAGVRRSGPIRSFLSAPAQFVVPNSGGKEIFHVRNFGNTYSGPITLQEATDISDNSVFSRLGILGLAKYGGTRRIARMATAMGIRTPVSHNYAMILGGLKVGVSPLDMAHAYETLATNGKKVFDPKLGDCTDGRDCGPTGIAKIQCGSACPPQYRDLVDHPATGGSSRLHRRDRARHARGTGGLRNGHGGGHSRCDCGREDRDHNELWRRLVRGLDPSADRSRVGGLPQQHNLDEHPVQWRPGGGRDLPGDHLA